MTLQKSQIEEMRDQNLVELKTIDHEAINELLQSNNLDWNVRLKPNYIFEGKKKFETGDFSVVRMPQNGYDFNSYQSVSDQYDPLQNVEFMEICYRVAMLCGSKITNVRSIKDGAKLYATIEGRQLTVPTKVGDIIKEKFILANSHDGTKGFTLSFGHEVVWCANLMTRFDRLGSIKIRHTTLMKEKLFDVIAKMESKIQPESDLMLGAYHKMIDTKMTTKKINKVLELVSGVHPNAKDVHPRTAGVLQRLTERIIAEKEAKGDNDFALWSGVTNYTSRLAEKNDSSLESKLFGAYGRTDLKVFNLLAPAVKRS